MVEGAKKDVGFFMRERIKETLMAERKKTEEMLSRAEQASREEEAPILMGKKHIADINCVDTVNGQRITQLTARLQKIDLAIERVDQGTYGACTSCGKQIPLARLQALPSTEHCVNCKAREESSSPNHRREESASYQQIAFD